MTVQTIGWIEWEEDGKNIHAGFEVTCNDEGTITNVSIKQEVATQNTDKEVGTGDGSST